MNRLARMAVATLAVLGLFTVGAGAAVAKMLPARLARLAVPRVSGAPVAAAGPGLRPATGILPGRAAGATAAGVASALSGLIAGGGLGPHVGVLVTNLTTGRVLYAQNASTGFTPASTTKLATATAALAVLGPAATFTTSVRAAGPLTARGARIVLIGGGDPTLAAAPFPAADYPQPATLAALAARTARALRASGVRSVRLGYDQALFSGPVQAAGWPALGAKDNYISTGNVAPITGLEVDQGRLTPQGTPENSDDPVNFLPRSMTPGLDAARAYATWLARDGITVLGQPAAIPRAGRGRLLAAVTSPPLTQIIGQMLVESNNVIAETLARQVAIATGRPATFSGGAAAVMAVDARLGVRGIRIYDGSGLSPLNSITPRALIRLLRLALARPRFRSVIIGAPVAGFSGTLAPGSYFGPFSPAALGTVRAKTGNLSSVAAMAGIAYTRGGQLLGFVFMGDSFAKKHLLLAMSTLAQLASAVAGCGCG